MVGKSVVSKPMATKKRLLTSSLLASLLAISGCQPADDADGQEQLKGNEQEIAKQMVDLIKQITRERAEQANNKTEAGSFIHRFNQVKTLGCFQAEFTVDDNLEQTLKQGVFASQRRYPALVRFANASKYDDGDKDLRGMSIRLFEVAGDSLNGVNGMQDFVLNSHPVLFASTPEDFLSFIQAQADDRLWWYFVNPFDSHFSSFKILLQARDRPNSPFDINYWSTTPYRLGEQVVKYKASACSNYQSPEPEKYQQNYLRAAMAEHLNQAPVCFDFMVQRQTVPSEMPIENAAMQWSEAKAPWQKLARLTIERQEFLGKDAQASCERSSFDPWQSLAAHQPLGRMNQVRRYIYAELAQFRNSENKAATAPSQQ